MFKTALANGLALEEKVLIRWIDVLMQRHYNLCFIVDFWEQIKDKDSRLEYYKLALQKYQKEYFNNPVETCRGTKMMLGKLYNSKDVSSH
jgi:hypothetical protein